jgi:hypothetical protein
MRDIVFMIGLPVRLFLFLIGYILLCVMGCSDEGIDEMKDDMLRLRRRK